MDGGLVGWEDKIWTERWQEFLFFNKIYVLRKPRNPLNWITFFYSHILRKLQSFKFLILLRKDRELGTLNRSCEKLTFLSYKVFSILSIWLDIQGNFQLKQEICLILIFFLNIKKLLKEAIL